MGSLLPVLVTGAKIVLLAAAVSVAAIFGFEEFFTEDWDLLDERALDAIREWLAPVLVLLALAVVVLDATRAENLGWTLTCAAAIAIAAPAVERAGLTTFFFRAEDGELTATASYWTWVLGALLLTGLAIQSVLLRRRGLKRAAVVNPAATRVEPGDANDMNGNSGANEVDVAVVTDDVDARGMATDIGTADAPDHAAHEDLAMEQPAADESAYGVPPVAITTPRDDPTKTDAATRAVARPPSEPCCTGGTAMSSQEGADARPPKRATNHLPLASHLSDPRAAALAGLLLGAVLGEWLRRAR